MSIENGNKVLFLLEDHSLFFKINELAKNNRITYYLSWVSDTHSAIDAISSNECKAIVVHAKFLDFFRQLRLISSSNLLIIVIYDIFSEAIDFYAKECRAEACIKIDNNKDFPHLLTQTILSAIEIDNISKLLRSYAFSTDKKLLGDSNQKYQKNWIKNDVEKKKSLEEVYSEFKNTFYEPKSLDSEQSYNKLIFKIRFPASHLNAGNSLINYISTLISHKFGTSSLVTIKQEGLNITLMIETQEGMREKVEQLIHDYVLFVRGDLPAESILSDPSHVQDLKDLLMVAQLQLQLKQGHLASAEDNTKFLQNQVDELTGILSTSFKKSLDQ